MNHTCDWDLLFEDKKMFHLPCQFNKKVIWINWSISRESLFLYMARTSMLKATKFIDQHLHNKHMMKMMSFNRTTMLMNLNIHYNKRGLFCDSNIIANNKERSFQKPDVANHNSSQTLKLLRYHNIRTRTIASPSQLPNLIQSQKISDSNYFYPLFAINITSETICSKPIIATT
jgi:hypothetical protein